MEPEKTTTMDELAGYSNDTSGTARIAGHDVQKIPRQAADWLFTETPPQADVADGLRDSISGGYGTGGRSPVR